MQFPWGPEEGVRSSRDAVPRDCELLREGPKIQSPLLYKRTAHKAPTKSK